MKIAIVKLSAMGDIIHAMVALQFLKKQRPDLQIDWIVEKGFMGVLRDNPHIDTLLPLELKAAKKSPSLFLHQIKQSLEYRKNDYDLIIDAQGLLKSAVTSCLLGRKRVGFSKDSIREKIASFCYKRHVMIPYHANTIDRNVKVIGAPLGVHITPEMIRAKEPFLFYRHDKKIEELKKRFDSYTVFVIGSTWESRNYPKERYLELAEILKTPIVIAWGNDVERQRAQWIASRCKNAEVAPKVDLNGLKALIAHSSLLIGNDTGPTHMAWGLNRPSVTIFGPTPTSRVYETPVNKVITSSSQVDPYRLNKEDYSIREIDPQNIANLAQSALAADNTTGVSP